MRPRSWSLAVIVVLVFWLYYERIMFAEEEFLRRTFAEVFEGWAERTPAFFPRFGEWRRPSLSFSLRNVLKREYSAVFAIGVSFAAIDVAENFAVSRQIRLDPFDATVFGLSALCYVILLGLKRHTRLLDVPGR